MKKRSTAKRSPPQIPSAMKSPRFLALALQGGIFAVAIVATTLTGWLLSAPEREPANGLRICKQRRYSTTEWNDWVKRVARAYPNIDFEKTSEILQRCQHHIAAANVSTGNLVPFVHQQAKIRRDDFEMGFEVPDRDYLAAQPKEMMALPHELADGLPDDWEDLFQERGWLYLRYTSWSVKNPPNDSMERLLVMVPGSAYDQWINFTFKDPSNPSSPPERMIDMIVMQKRDSSQNIQPKIHFRQYVTNSRGNRPLLRTRGQLGKTENCYSCHATGMREIIPAPGSLQPVVALRGEEGSDGVELARKRLDRLNKRMRDYGKVSWGSSLDPATYGPPLGAVVGCNRCHDGQARGILNAGADAESVRHKMVRELTMPPTRLTEIRSSLETRMTGGSTGLNPAESDHLHAREKLNEEYWDLYQRASLIQMRHWLRGN